MKKYEYQPLNNPKEEIRLLSLLPGSPTDDLKLRLWPVFLPGSIPEPQDEEPEDATTQMQDTLPPGWVCGKTPEGPFIFENEETEETTWTHPSTIQDDGATPSVAAVAATTPPPPRYEALSYVWGSQDDPDVAFIEAHDPAVNAGDSSGELSITQNLAVALRSLRLVDQERTLWVDAICINQAYDSAEKESQIPRMAAIYTLAQRVIIWLGPETDDSELALSTLAHLGRQVQIDVRNFRYRSPEATEKRWFHPAEPLPYSQAVCESIRRLLSREYFERLWIVQEILLADSNTSIIQCGGCSHQMSLYEFRRAVPCLSDKEHLSPMLGGQPNYLEPLLRSSGRRRPGIPVETVLGLVRQRKCFSPWDKIYGVLGIVEHSFARMVSPKYSLPVAHVYTDVFTNVLKRDERLQLLRQCELLRDLDHQDGAKAGIIIDGLPTWVPDWSKPRKTAQLRHFVFSSGLSRACAVVEPPNRLRVTGRKFATVQAVAPAAPDTELEALRHMRSWEPDDLFEKKDYVGGGSLLDAFLSTLAVGYLSERYQVGVGPMDSLEVWRQDYLTKVRCPVDSGKKQQQQQKVIGAGNLGVTMFEAAKLVKSRTLVTTEDGHLGLGPPCAKSGDIICAILGCTSSMMLREDGVGTGRYLVVGECYIHGMDDASGILGPLPDGWDVVISDFSFGGVKHQYRYRPRRHDGNDDEDGGPDDDFLTTTTTTTTTTSDDPRLPVLAHPWEALPIERNPGGLDFVARFANVETGETLDSDPRMLPEALRAMGVELQTFLLS